MIGYHVRRLFATTVVGLSEGPVSMKLSRHWKPIGKFFSAKNIAGTFTAVAAGTSVAFLLWFLFPLIVPCEQILNAYVRRSLPPHTVAMALTFCTAILAIIIIDVVVRIWRSLRLGLI